MSQKYPNVVDGQGRSTTLNPMPTLKAPYRATNGAKVRTSAPKSASVDPGEAGLSAPTTPRVPKAGIVRNVAKVSAGRRRV